MMIVESEGKNPIDWSHFPQNSFPLFVINWLVGGFNYACFDSECIKLLYIFVYIELTFIFKFQVKKYNKISINKNQKFYINMIKTY